MVYLLGHALVDAGVGSDASNLAGNALHALLALDHGHVDVLHALNQRVLCRVWGRGIGFRRYRTSYDFEVRQARLWVDRVSTRVRDMIRFGRGWRLGSGGVTSDWEIAPRLR